MSQKNCDNSGFRLLELMTFDNDKESNIPLKENKLKMPFSSKTYCIEDNPNVKNSNN